MSIADMSYSGHLVKAEIFWWKQVNHNHPLEEKPLSSIHFYTDNW